MKKIGIIFAVLVLSLTVMGQTTQTPAADAKPAQTSAVETNRAKVAAEPNNAEALAGLIEAMEAEGEWRAATPFLERLVVLRPNDNAPLAQLGRWYTWQNRKADGVLLLKKACDSGSKDPQYCTSYAEVLAWGMESRREAVQLLRSVVAQNPDYLPARMKLAQFLSWNGDTYQESLRIFTQLAEQQPKDSALLTGYADALSSSNTKQALAMYDRALAVDGDNANALTGKAQMLAWSGHSKEAEKIYDRVVQKHPKNVAALRGKAEILNWRGEYAQALQLLAEAKAEAPDDARVMAEVARAQVGLQRYRKAKLSISGMPADSQYNDVREDVFRGLATWVETGVEVRRNRQNLDYEKLLMAVSTPLGANNRLTVRFAPTLYDTRADEFNSNSYGVKIDSRLSDRWQSRLEASSESYPGITPQVSGGYRLNFRPNRKWTFSADFEREASTDSVLALRGLNTTSGFAGQVASNLGNVGVAYDNAKHGFDLSANYSDGYYTGRGLDANRRWAVDGQIGKSVAGTPYIRLAYGVSYSSFEYDAESATAGPRQTGGYFSPQRFLLNYLAVTISHKFNRRVGFEMTGTAGAQNVESTTAVFANAQFASSFTSVLAWRMTAGNELRLEYRFLNVYNAFHRHLPSITWRHYF